MHSATLQKRIRSLNQLNPKSGKCVFYVMSRDQRSQDNAALTAAQNHAIKLAVPLIVVFNLQKRVGQRSAEQYDFMLDGLRLLEKSLNNLNISFLVLVGGAVDNLAAAVMHLEPAALYFDFSPLRGSLDIQQKLSRKLNAPCFVVDAHNIVPVWLTSQKQEFSARTIRPKISQHLEEFLKEKYETIPHKYKCNTHFLSINQLEKEVGGVLMKLPKSGVKHNFASGQYAAQTKLNNFINLISGYNTNRNDPSKSAQSNLSPYLHFGQISSADVVRAGYIKIQKDHSVEADVRTLVEEIVVRKELADNFCLYNKNYDNLNGAPSWAIATLEKHKVDIREFTYSYDQFKDSETHDPAWNAAQMELRLTGKMHGYMRMYWAKKVLEWSENPTQACEHLIKLNDFYSIDGGDPNGYVGILWSIAGLHDRAWGERPVFGTVRSMVYAGLKRKFNVSAYQNLWLSES